MNKQKIDEVLSKITRFVKHETYRQIKFAVLTNRLLTNPITNKAVARYVWDLHEMNFN